MPGLDFTTPPVALPATPRPIVLIGAGGIARDAHLPAYQRAGFPVALIADRDPSRAAALAADFKLPAAASVVDAIAHAPADAIFDLAVPASALAEVLARLPAGASVLIQKPFGETLAHARALRTLCNDRSLVAAVNFQLRFAPAVRTARALIAAGAIGELHDIEARVTVHTPWHLWTFLQGLPRVEILYHSIHYVDLIRSFLGDPAGVWAQTTRSPAAPDLAATRTTMAFDYGDSVRATITTNHSHDCGSRHQESYLKWEGTRGAIKARLGVLLDYPRGEPDALELCQISAGSTQRHWQTIPVDGTWFPDAFIGPMATLQRVAVGESTELPTTVSDAIRTMAVVEAAYLSNATGATPIPSA